MNSSTNILHNTRLLYLLSCTSLIALILLCTTWELWIAPLRAGGSMLVLKVVPLLLGLFGILRGKRYTYQWMSMLILLYFTEGTVRATSDTGLSQQLAMAETALTILFFAGAIYYARATRASQPRRAG